MGTRQPTRLGQPAYGLPDATLADGSSGSPSPLIPILLLFVGLAVATVWFVALPALTKPARAERTCEVIVLKSGTTKCVREPTRGSRATPHQATTRSKH
jgi:hypothetical protein